MNIAIVSPMVVGFGKSPTTYSSQQLNLASRWANMGHDVDLMTLPNQGLDQLKLPGNVRIKLLPGSLLSRRGFPIMFGVMKNLRKKKYDFVLSSEHYQPVTALACIASPNVAIYQGQNSEGNSFKTKLLLGTLEKTFGKISKNRCKGVVAKTKKAAEYVESLGFSPVKYIPCGFDENRFFPPTSEERMQCRNELGLNDEFVLVYAGNLIERRDIHTLIEAVYILKNKGTKVSLLVAGDGPQRKVLEELVDKRNLSKNIKFLGLLSWKQLREVYWAGDIFVFPSKYEIFGMVLTEAMACGLPVLSTPVGVARDLVSEDNGDIFKVGNSRELFTKIKCLINHPKKLKNMREHLPQSVNEYSWKSIASRILTTIRKEM